MIDEFDDDDEMLFEGAQCSRCDLDLNPRTGMCPNARCPFHSRFQDEIVKWGPPSQDEEIHIARIRIQPES